MAVILGFPFVLPATNAAVLLDSWTMLHTGIWFEKDELYIHLEKRSGIKLAAK